MLYLSSSPTIRSAQGMGSDRAAISGASRATFMPGFVQEERDPTAGHSHPTEEFNIDPMCTHCPNLAPTG